MMGNRWEHRWDKSDSETKEEKQNTLTKDRLSKQK